MSRHSPDATLLHPLAGAVLGIVILHPATMAIYWFEFHPDVPSISAFWEFVATRLRGAFTPGMLAMSGLFALLGGSVGLGSGLYTRALTHRDRRLENLERELARDLSSLIEAGENELVELKASARWDREKRSGNRQLEEAIVRTIAGFLNHRGGSLLIGVDDDGRVVGLRQDYETLGRFHDSCDFLHQDPLGLARVRLAFPHRSL